MNIHAAGNKLLGEIRSGTGYKCQVMRTLKGTTVYGDEFIANLSPHDGTFSTQEGISLYYNDRTAYVPVEAFAKLNPPEPIRGDRVVDLDHCRVYQLLPQNNNRHWVYHGTDEKHYRLLLKDEGPTQ